MERTKIYFFIVIFPVCTYKSQNFAQSQLNFAPSHDGETVTFRNSASGEDQTIKVLPS